MSNFLDNAYIQLHRKKLIKELKPRFVFWYILADGDPKKVADYMDQNYGVYNSANFNKVLKDVNLDDYVFVLEKDFTYYSDYKTKDYVVFKKSERIGCYLFKKAGIEVPETK
jgi:hypothetical protein